MATSVQITLIICITFLLLNISLIIDCKSKDDIKTISPPRPISPPPKKQYSYEIFTKEDYIRYCLTKCKADEMSYISKNLHGCWEDLSKGYNFIIVTGEANSPMFYSVEFFNNEVLGGKANENYN